MDADWESGRAVKTPRVLLLNPCTSYLLKNPKLICTRRFSRYSSKKPTKCSGATLRLRIHSFSTQMIVSTHSSHIAHELDFSCLRYFRREPAKKNGEIPTATVINLSQTFGDHDETSKFATRYLRTTHCDLFFADAAILVEGSAERMLIPHFVREKFPRLDQSYISLLEIGGAHAHRLKPLLDTLGLLSLVVTDLDSIHKTDTAKARPERGKGYRTGNTTLKDWVPKKEPLDDLLDLPDDAKQTADGLVRVAYQCPVTVEYKEGEGQDEAIPYTFEDSLALTNLALFRRYAEPVGLLKKLQAALGKDSLEDASNDMFSDLEKGSKAELALELLYRSEPDQLGVCAAGKFISMDR